MGQLSPHAHAQLVHRIHNGHVGFSPDHRSNAAAATVGLAIERVEVRAVGTHAIDLTGARDAVVRDSVVEASPLLSMIHKGMT